jgi:hypothetical protein
MAISSLKGKREKGKGKREKGKGEKAKGWEQCTVHARQSL